MERASDGVELAAPSAVRNGPLKSRVHTSLGRRAWIGLGARRHRAGGNRRRRGTTPACCSQRCNVRTAGTGPWR